jgi:Protein of unknown function (DUF429)
LGFDADSGRRPLPSFTVIAARAPATVVGLLGTDRRHRVASREPLDGLEERVAENVDRAGGGRVVGVYPAASLVVWDLPADRFKGADNAEAGARLLHELADLLLEGAPVSEVTRSACKGSHDALDAVVASLAARAAAPGPTHPPGADEQRELAPVEGWIHLPRTDSLPLLAADRDGRRRGWGGRRRAGGKRVASIRHFVTPGGQYRVAPCSFDHCQRAWSKVRPSTPHCSARLTHALT